MRKVFNVNFQEILSGGIFFFVRDFLFVRNESKVPEMKVFSGGEKWFLSVCIYMFIVRVSLDFIIFTYLEGK